MRISDWSSDVCSSDLRQDRLGRGRDRRGAAPRLAADQEVDARRRIAASLRPFPKAGACDRLPGEPHREPIDGWNGHGAGGRGRLRGHAFRDVAPVARRSEEHTSELQSLMRNSYAVFCLKNTKQAYLT